ncbi:MAG: hypothetical protein ACQEUZ_05270 [Pseudomonadota bacterium]
MPLDGFHAPAADLAALAAEAREAELALSRRLPPGVNWMEAEPRDPAFDAAREVFRAAHRRLCALRDDEAAGEEDSDGWPDEPFGD